MSALYLSRAQLRRDASITALAPLLLPPDPAMRAGATHRLIWSLFADDPDGARDFLYREAPQASPGMPRGGFLILSRRPPQNDRLFEIETKPFSPMLSAGDRLFFSLRANPAINRRDAEGRNHRHDVVMDALKATPRGPDRPAARKQAIVDAGQAWLRAQEDRKGFALVKEPLSRIDGYGQIRIPRPGGKPIVISMLDIEGVLTVTDPQSFLKALSEGFGRAKAFGCGLMLIRRA